MKYMLFSVYDSQTKLFDFPTCAVNQHDYIRQISLLVNDGKSRYAVYKDDLSVYQIGDFDTDIGIPVPLKEPHRLVYLKELVLPEKPDSPKALIEEIKQLIASIR